VRGAQPGDVVAIDLIELVPFGSGKSAILRDSGVLRREFPEPMALSSPVRDGRAWFGGRIPLPLNPNLGTISTMPPEGYKPSFAGAYGGDFDQKDAGQGSRVYLPVLVEDALVFFGDPHAAISDGIITGTGIECSTRINLLKDRELERPIIAQGGAVHFVAVGPSVEEATEDAARRAVDFTVARSDLGREEAYMLLSIIGELRVGTSPRPVMATRLIVPEEQLRAAGWNGELP
jgi:amidase